MGATHEGQCKICMILDTEDIEALEHKALNRKLSYHNIGKEFGIKYNISITAQQISNHMKWLKSKRLDPERDKILEEQSENMSLSGIEKA